MLFQTWVFLIFMAVVYPVYLLARGSRFEKYWLLVASYFFYGWWNPLYLTLIAFSTLIDYVAARVMHEGGRRKSALVVSVITNLGLLAVFKYGNFLAENMEYILRIFIENAEVPRHGFLLPVGISFYTFQSMSYTIDVYRGHLKPEKNFATFALYVSFFPQLVAGPIERATNLLPQFQNPRRLGPTDVSAGLSLIITGLFKKMVLADLLAGYADKVYGSGSTIGDISTVSGIQVLLATYCFAWQIYFDFSAYSDIARGVARMMGFDLMLNFNAPYLAANPSDFWRRWHISLSTWLRDYLYIPLGGNRCSKTRMRINLAIVMILGGIWHGNTWNFVIWGTIHAILLIGGNMLQSVEWIGRIPKVIRQIVFFHMICLTWIFFRAPTVAASFALLGRLFGQFLGSFQVPWIAFAAVGVVVVVQSLNESENLRWIVRSPVSRIAAIAVMLVFLLVASTGGASPFIYFQF